MRKPYIWSLLFLVLMLALIAGSSHLSLNHVSKSKGEQDDTSMNVALVNEDDGAAFNQNQQDFGDQFVKSVNKRKDHDWNVVSRGVAEKGLKQGAYDMMLVIPKDFSQQALSMMDSDDPEQVVLDYKIHASENDKVREQAEEQASSILNDFNRQIIDVYFASVIGNLQDAQDDVEALVNEEAEHTYTYNNAIDDKLSNYTDQFGNVKDNTALSKDRFRNLEDILDTFDDSLTDQADTDEDYLSNIEEVVEQKESNNDPRSAFMEQLDNYNEGLNSEDVAKQLDHLQDTNQSIHKQFQNDPDDDEMKNIVSDTKILKRRLHEALATVEDSHDELEEELGDGGNVDQQVRERLSDVIGDAFDDDNSSLRELFTTQDQRINNKIDKQISNLPSLDERGIENSDLSSNMKQEIQNVMKVTDKYQGSDNGQDHNKNNNETLPDYIQELKRQLHEDGITMTDTADVPENNNADDVFRLHEEEIPDAFEIEDLSITFNDEAIETDGLEAVIPAGHDEGKLKVTLTLKLKDMNEAVSNDLLTAPKWKWTLSSEQKEGETASLSGGNTSVQTPSARLTASTKAEDEKSADDKDEKRDESDESEDDENADESDDNRQNADDKDGEGNEEDASEDEETEDDSESGNDDTKGEHAEDNDEGDAGDKEEDSDEDDSEDENKENENEDEDEEEDEEDESADKGQETTNNNIEHEVTDPEIDESTKKHIHMVENTIAPYQKLLSMYETYYGLDLTCENGTGCQSVDARGDWENMSLEEMASEDSLYYFFHEKNMKELLFDQIVDGVTQEIRDPLEELEAKIDDHREYIEETDENAKALVEKVADTREETQNLNDNMEEILENIAEWREKSNDLVDSQIDIQDKNDDEQSAVMELGSGFEPLLTQSQSLADQASGNLDSADNVYQTFDNIDDQAESIQDSGQSLVQQAGDLSTTMTDKVIEDEDFADNFSDVMDNSKVGDRQNKDLYQFLSNPVDTENKGLMVKGDTFTPYFLVLINFIVALFTAYVLASTNKRQTEAGQFDTEQSLIGSNMLITGITAGIGFVEGLVIGVLSAYYLGISGGNLMLWTGLMILMMLSMLLVSTYLLRQLHMIGMFILLAMLSMYLLLTKALGSGFSGSDELRAYSPLQYLEKMLTDVVQGELDYPFILFSVITLIILAVLANLLVLPHAGRNATKDDEGAANAQ